MPRLVFDPVQREVASVAARMVAPSGRCAGVGEHRADRDRARQEILVAGVVEMALGGDVARLGRAHFEQAGELRRGRDLLPGHGPRRARWSTSAPATSIPVASCNPRQPGMPFTSST